MYVHGLQRSDSLSADMFQALFGMCGSWLVCFLLTIFDVLPSKSDEYGYSARTDISLDAVTNSPWFHVPYPGLYASKLHY